MRLENIVILGGGYAGINAVHYLQQNLNPSHIGKFQIILIDREPYHFRKVKIFKAAVSDENLKIPFSLLFDQQVDFIQASLNEVHPDRKTLSITYPDGSKDEISYDRSRCKTWQTCHLMSGSLRLTVKPEFCRLKKENRPMSSHLTGKAI